MSSFLYKYLEVSLLNLEIEFRNYGNVWIFLYLEAGLLNLDKSLVCHGLVLTGGPIRCLNSHRKLVLRTEELLEMPIDLKMLLMADYNVKVM